MNKAIKYFYFFVFYSLFATQLKGDFEINNRNYLSSKDTLLGATELFKKSNQEKNEGNYSLAIKYLFQIDNLLVDDTQKTKLYIELTKIFISQGNDAMARKYYNLAKANIQIFPDEELLGDIYWLKSQMSYNAFKFSVAYQNALKALVFYKDEKSEGNRAETLNLLSKIYLEQNKLRLAVQSAHKYRTLSIALNDELKMANSNNTLAVIYARLNMRDSSLIFAHNAMDLAKKKNSLFRIAKSYQTLSTINEEWNNAGEALAYYKKFTLLNDSLNSINRTREVAQLEAIHEAENQKALNRKLVEESKVQELIIKGKEDELKLYLIGLVLVISLSIVALFFLNKSRIANKKLLKLSTEIRGSRDKIKLSSDKLRASNSKLVKIQAALIAQKETAIRASSAKDVFLATVSHELRTPLTAILGLTDELLPEAANAQTKDNLEVIKFSGETLLTLVNDILDFNKIQSGKIELEHISFNLKELLNKQVKGLKPRARRNASVISYSYHENVPVWVIADPFRIGQVINNLLSNAVKFTNRGKIELNIELLSIEGDLNHILFSVADQGIGIPKDKLEYIFERFSQASTDTTRKFGGTGLGLAISKRIIELYKSNIQVVSEPDVGSTFSFVLKLKKGFETKDVQTAVEELELNNEIKILLVEDNLVNQKLIARAFSSIGIAIHIVSNGRQALDCLERDYNEFDIILMDLHMPVMDGIEATIEIRKRGGYLAKIPIIGLSGSTVKEAPELKEIGLSTFMQKPFKKDELLKLVADQIVKA